MHYKAYKCKIQMTIAFKNHEFFSGSQFPPKTKEVTGNLELFFFKKI